MKFLAGLFLSIILGALVATLFHSQTAAEPGNRTADDEPTYQGEAADFWLAQMENSDPVYRQTAVIALGEMGLHDDDRVHDAVLKAARDEDGDVRFMAINSLQKIRPQDPRTIDTFIAVLADSNRLVRIQAVIGLGHAGRPSNPIISGLVGALHDADCIVRQQALQALGRYGPAAHQVLSEVTAALQDPFPPVRDAAGVAKAKIESSSRMK